MQRILCVVLLLIITTVSIASAADPKSGEARGNLIVDGKPLALHYAIAATGPDSFDKTKEAVMVLLTTQPISQTAVDGAKSFDDVRSLAREGIVYRFQQGDHYHLTVRHAVLAGTELQTSGSLSDSKITVDPTAVSGTFTNDETIFDHKMNFNVAFNAPIARRFALEKLITLSSKAKKLAPGGGEAGNAYLAEKCGPSRIPKTLKETEAIMAKDGLLPSEEDLKAMSKAEGKTVTRADVIKQFFDMATAMSVLQMTDCKVLGGLEEGDVAIIQVRATQAKVRQETDVTMVREANKWIVKKEGSWAAIR
jgi:hypothetical protein